MTSKPYPSSSHPSPSHSEIGDYFFTDFEIRREFVRRTICDAELCSNRLWAWIDEVEDVLNPKAALHKIAGGSKIGRLVSGGEGGNSEAGSLKAMEIEAEAKPRFTESFEMMMRINFPCYFDLVKSSPFTALNMILLLVVRCMCGKLLDLD